MQNVSILIQGAGMPNLTRSCSPKLHTLKTQRSKTMLCKEPQYCAIVEDGRTENLQYASDLDMPFKEARVSI